MTTTDIRDRVRSYLTENFLYMRPGYDLRDGDSLLGAGIIDSMGAMELVAFVEEEFGVAVQDDEITEDHFGTLDAIVSYVDAKQQTPRALAS
jgi:acyl carrier protein